MIPRVSTYVGSYIGFKEMDVTYQIQAMLFDRHIVDMVSFCNTVEDMLSKKNYDLSRVEFYMRRFAILHDELVTHAKILCSVIPKRPGFLECLGRTLAFVYKWILRKSCWVYYELYLISQLQLQSPYMCLNNFLGIYFENCINFNEAADSPFLELLKDVPSNFNLDEFIRNLLDHSSF